MIWLLSSRATPTTMMRPVPPSARLESLPNTPLKVKMTGSALINVNEQAPISVILFKTLRTYFSVSIPGRIPGM